MNIDNIKKEFNKSEFQRIQEIKLSNSDNIAYIIKTLLHLKSKHKNLKIVVFADETKKDILDLQMY